MKKLCYVLPQYYKNSTENFYHIINFLEHLATKVELYVIIENSDDNPIIKNAKEIFVINKEKKMNCFFRLSLMIQIYFKLYKKGVTCFFARASTTGAFPMLIANRFLNFNRATIIFWSCGQDIVPLSFEPTKKNFKRIVTKLLSKFIFSRINYLATGPELMVDYYNEYYKIPKEKILLLYNDISLNRFIPLAMSEKLKLKKELLNTDKKIMLFVHTYNYSRGTDLLHKIALEIKKNNASVKILAIGRQGDYTSQLNEEIKQYDLDEYLINLGSVANKDIVKYYQMSDLFIMPSRGEGFPRVIIEAMACKCVPFAFDVGGVANILHNELIEDTMVNVNDVDGFIRKSLNLIENDTLLLKYADLSYEKVKEYETEKIVKMYLDTFDLIDDKMQKISLTVLDKTDSSDIENIVKMDYQAYEKYGKSYSNEIWDKKNFLYALPQKKELSYIFKYENEIYGFCIASIKNDSIYIHRFLVRQNSKKLSKVFFKELETYYKSKDIILMVNEKNINAIKFYSSFGFNIEQKNEAIKSYVSKSLEVRDNLINVEKDYTCCLMVRKR